MTCCKHIIHVQHMQALYGTYANWLFTTLGAAFGTAAANPITSAGHTGKPWQEKFEGAGFLSVGVSIIASSVLVLLGLRRSATLPEKPEAEQNSVAV